MKTNEAQAVLDLVEELEQVRREQLRDLAQVAHAAYTEGWLTGRDAHYDEEYEQGAIDQAYVNSMVAAQFDSNGEDDAESL